MGLLVLCAATMHGQDLGTLAGMSLADGLYAVEVTTGAGLNLSLGLIGNPTSGETRERVAASALSVITMQPTDRTVPEGTPTTFSVSVAHPDDITVFQWRHDGTAIPDANSASYSILSTGLTDAGQYLCEVQNREGTKTTSPAMLTVMPAAQAGHIASFSVVTSLDAADAQTVIGCGVGGAGTLGAKSVLVRAAGPSLVRFGIADRNPAPRLELFSGATKLGENTRWGGQASIVEAAARVGAFPFVANGSTDAAMLVDVTPTASDTIRISGDGGATGIVLAEIYDATPAAAVTSTTPRFVRCSVLKMIPAGANVSVGFVVAGQTPRTVLIRALGPALEKFGVTDAMPDPVLTLYQGVTPIAVNDDWGGASALASAFASVGASTLGASAKDAALVVRLARGSYAIEASEAGNAGGIVLVEIYELP